MSQELQTLIPSSRRRSSLDIIYDELNDYLLKPLDLWGALSGTVTTYYSLACRDCHDRKCLHDANRVGIYTGISVAYALCLFHIAKILLIKSYPVDTIFLEKTNIVLNKFIKILNDHIFFLYVGSAIAATIANACTIPNWQFWSIIFPIVMGFTLLCNIPKGKNKILDTVTALLEGGSTMIGTISGISNIHDSIYKISPSSPDSWVYSNNGMITRYSLGGAYGMFQSGFKYYYLSQPSNTQKNSILNSPWPSILQALLGSVTFCILTAFSIKNTNSFDFILMVSLSVGFILMGLAMTGNEISRSLARNSHQPYYNTVRSYDDNSSAGTSGPVIVEENENLISGKESALPQKTETTQQNQIQTTTHTQTNTTSDNSDNTVAQFKNKISNFSFKETSKILNNILFYKKKSEDIITQKEPQTTIENSSIEDNFYDQSPAITN